MFYRSEPHFLKTGSQQALLEALICKMVQRFAAASDVVEAPVKRQATVSRKMVEQRPVRQNSPHPGTFENKERLNPLSSSVRQSSEGVTTDVSRTKSDQQIAESYRTEPQAYASAAAPQNASWEAFLQELETKNHPIAISIFKQGNFVKVEQNVLRVRFAKKFEFYYDWMRTNEPLRRPPLEAAFGAGIMFSPEFVAVATAPVTASESPQVAKAPASEMRRPTTHEARPVQGPQEKIDITDTEKWRMANMVAEMFPGTITTRKE